MTLEKFGPRPGGAWRCKPTDDQGNVYGFHGVNHEVLPPELLIDTFEFEGLPDKGHVSPETARFEDLQRGRTKLTIHSVFQSVADRDGMVGSGMEQGISEFFERLDELLAKTQVPPP